MRFLFLCSSTGCEAVDFKRGDDVDGVAAAPWVDEVLLSSMAVVVRTLVSPY
ncbi:hypothetical protein OAE26_01545 [Synechococcus sp. AH-551-E05]|nr:hypothetical protein [Synechococcus sp. AH-551-E05]MDB4651247.1 hypothetical protein [Synechococcus sp. AH-551-E05]